LAGIFACVVTCSQSFPGNGFLTIFTCNLTGDGTNPPPVVATGSVALSNGVTAGTPIVIPITKLLIPFGNDVQNVHDVQITVQGQGPTRTPGFWQTHLAFANTVWNTIPPSQRIIGTHNMGDGKTVIGTTTTCTAGDICDDQEMMGGFWSSIPKTTTGAQRSTLDQDRMILLQQLEAAMLNVQAFGTSDNGLIAAGKAAFAGTDTNAIMTVEAQLDAFNQGGDNLTPPGFSAGPATPKQAQSFANMLFWNVLP
jgi:hypothetical protein